MDLLLDTHVLLWWDQDAPDLAAPVRKLIANPDHRVFVSAASPWEIAIKAKLGKLSFTGSPAALISANAFLPLPIQPAHAEAAGLLDWSHRDPFDRVLVVQAQMEGLTLVHADGVIRALGGVPQLWARATPGRSS